MSESTDNTQTDHIVDMHEMVTDTNQAIEDELDTILKQHREWMRGFYIKTDHLIGTSHAETKAAIQSLIRTEKLKLLAEVRERVIGDNDRYTITNPNSTRYGEQYESTMADKDELRAALTKLEAEL